MPEEELIETVYAAALFDGEGSACVCYASSLPTIRLCFGQNDLRPLERVKRSFGGTIYPTQGKQNHLEFHEASPALKLLQAIQPFICIRKTKVALAIEILKLVGLKDDKSKLMRWKLAAVFEELSNED